MFEALGFSFRIVWGLGPNFRMFSGLGFGGGGGVRGCTA